MVLYQCDRCLHQFTKKIDYTRHCKRKFPCQIKKAEIDINADDQIINVDQLETPLFYEDPSGWSLVYGQAIMSMLNESMNTNTDEQIYFYGVKSYGANKEMTVGRANVENLISQHFD